MRVSNRRDGAFPRKSNNETVTPHRNKQIRLKPEPKENPTYRQEDEEGISE